MPIIGVSSCGEPLPFHSVVVKVVEPRVSDKRRGATVSPGRDVELDTGVPDPGVSSCCSKLLRLGLGGGGGGMGLSAFGMVITTGAFGVPPGKL